MPKESHLEIKVGSFVVIALILLTSFVFSISDSSIFEHAKKIKVIFEFANGLKKSAPVRVAGVEQGLVTDIKLFFDYQDSKMKAEVALNVKHDTQIPVDSVFMINQLGLLGEKYVEIIPGKDTKEFVAEGQTVIGKNPINQEVLSEKIMLVANNLEQTIAGVNHIINDEENIASIRQTFKNLSDVTGGLKDIIVKVNTGQGTVGKLLSDDQLYKNVEGLTSDLKQNPWKLLYRPKGAK